MGNSDLDESRKALIAALLRRAHEQSRASAERSPFWREGQWRCEYYTTPGPDRLKLFSGGRCVVEEPVSGSSRAGRRARGLRRGGKRVGVAGVGQAPLE